MHSGTVYTFPVLFKLNGETIFCSRCWGNTKGLVSAHAVWTALSRTQCNGTYTAQWQPEHLRLRWEITNKSVCMAIRPASVTPSTLQTTDNRPRCLRRAPIAQVIIWNRQFESSSKNGYMLALYCLLFSCVIQTLWRAGSPSKEPYQRN